VAGIWVRESISDADAGWTCPIPEIARRFAGGQQVLAYFSTKGVSNGGTEAIDLLIEKNRRPAHSIPKSQDTVAIK